METQSTSRMVQRVRHDIKFRDVTVARIARIGASMLAITFTGESLADFVSSSFDDHVKFIFPDAGGNPVRRDYTPTGYDRQRRELTLMFALHAEGAATDWARRATPGMQAVIAGPRGSTIYPDDVDWHLLTGDLAALPAIERRIGELPAGARVTAMIAVPDEGDIRELSTASTLDMQWFKGAEALLAAIRALALPAGDGYIWAAGEASGMKQLRSIFIDEKQHPKNAIRVAAYWKHGAVDFQEKLD